MLRVCLDVGQLAVLFTLILYVENNEAIQGRHLGDQLGDWTRKYVLFVFKTSGGFLAVRCVAAFVLGVLGVLGLLVAGVHYLNGSLAYCTYLSDGTVIECGQVDE